MCENLISVILFFLQILKFPSLISDSKNVWVTIPISINTWKENILIKIKKFVSKNCHLFFCLK